MFPKQLEGVFRTKLYGEESRKRKPKNLYARDDDEAQW